MKRLLLASAASCVLTLGIATTAATAAPAPGDKLGSVSSNVEKVYWRRVCDRDGDRCRRVWVRDDDRRSHWWWRLRHRDRDRD